MPYHPADGPRLSTLYVPRSQRIRRRSSSARRRVRTVVLGIVAVVLLIAAAVMYRDTITRRAKKLITRPRPQAVLRDAGGPVQPVDPPVATPSAVRRP